MKNLMNLKGAKLLSKVEQKSINGGAGGNGPCQIYTASEGWMSDYSVEAAQWMYANDPEVTGYCCASCGGIQ